MRFHPPPQPPAARRRRPPKDWSGKIFRASRASTGVRGGTARGTPSAVSLVMRRTAKATPPMRNSYLPTPSDEIRRESPPPPRESRGFGERIALALTEFTGSTPAFILAALTIVVWAALGPFLGFSEN